MTGNVAERRNLPWDKKWVRLLHERIKGMHWNCLRYCIGFPPSFKLADLATADPVPQGNALPNGTASFLAVAPNSASQCFQ
jgi:hypothetical protein